MLCQLAFQPWRGTSILRCSEARRRDLPFKLMTSLMVMMDWRVRVQQQAGCRVIEDEQLVTESDSRLGLKVRVDFVLLRC